MNQSREARTKRWSSRPSRPLQQAGLCSGGTVLVARLCQHSAHIARDGTAYSTSSRASATLKYQAGIDRSRGDIVIVTGDSGIRSSRQLDRGGHPPHR